ncbi:MAG: 50S ribosomal protein L21 [Candidatus Staskawiczbacteria bacterium]|nr:50S ribosomal protein L21 [Candidatus Staskawiczbacteria bacterium]
MIAVIKTGGKQYLVSPGDKIKVEKLEAEEGSEVLFSEVLLCDQDGKSQIGAPLVKGASVTAKVTKNGKGKKLVIFKYKPKKRYKRKIGHRQTFTEVEILEIKN